MRKWMITIALVLATACSATGSDTKKPEAKGGKSGCPVGEELVCAGCVDSSKPGGFVCSSTKGDPCYCENPKKRCRCRPVD